MSFFRPSFVLSKTLSDIDPVLPECFIIEGENLRVITDILPTWENGISVIYLDPPYNTGSTHFAYLDRSDGFSQNDKHASWVRFMRDRLVLARRLLEESGVIFISIDDSEQARLRLLCDDVFGESNFVAQFVWHKTRKGKALSRLARQVTEYVMCYAKSKTALSEVGLFGEVTDSTLANPLFHRPNRVTDISFPAGVIETSWSDGVYVSGVYGDPLDSLSPCVLEPFTVSCSVIVTELKLRGRFRWSQKTLDNEIASLNTRFALRSGELRIVFFRSGGHKAPSSLLDSSCGVGTYEEGTSEVSNLLGSTSFVYPKPVSLIKYLLRAGTNKKKGGVILDFFAGTGTTGHAVAALNAEDGGYRRCILVNDNSGKVEDVFVSDANENGICRGVTLRRMKAVKDLGLPVSIEYFQYPTEVQHDHDD